MTTGFPAAIDTIATLKNDANDATVTATTHAAAHDNVADSLMAIETELGTLPKGVYTDVKTRLNDSLYKTPSGAQVIRPSADIVPWAVRKNTGTDISNLSEWRDHLNAIFAFLDANGVFSAQSFRVAGTLLNSTHLSDSASLARLASPTFTGTPAAPTPTPGDNTTKIATTAFTTAAIAAASPGVGSITSAMILDGTIVPGDVAAGAFAGQSYGGAFPTTGLYNGYRFTLFFNSIQGDFIYRVDLDASYPWHAVACPPIVLRRTSSGTSSVTFARAGVYRGSWSGAASVSSLGDASVGSSFAGSGIGTSNQAFGGSADEFTTTAGGTASISLGGTNFSGGNVGALFFPVRLI